MTNVGNIPLDIYQDFLLDVYNIDFDWVYMSPVFNSCPVPICNTNFGHGFNQSFGYGFCHGYGVLTACGNGDVFNNRRWTRT